MNHNSKRHGLWFIDIWFIDILLAKCDGITDRLSREAVSYILASSLLSKAHKIWASMLQSSGAVSSFKPHLGILH